MANTKTTTISFPASGSPDVVAYRLYVCDGTDDVSAVDPDGAYTATSHNLGNKTSVNLNTLLGNLDGTYNIGVTAIDDAGNESDMSVVTEVPLDFTAPDAPGPISVTRN